MGSAGAVQTAWKPTMTREVFAVSVFFRFGPSRATYHVLADDEATARRMIQDRITADGRIERVEFEFELDAVQGEA